VYYHLFRGEDSNNIQYDNCRVQIFERVFSDLDQDKRQRLKKEYVTKEKIAEAPSRIRKICLDLINHYTTHIEPEGYKAMLVATSREAAFTYKRELDKLNSLKLL
jgi:type I restriction enzyme R subunit